MAAALQFFSSHTQQPIPIHVRQGSGEGKITSLTQEQFTTPGNLTSKTMQDYDIKHVNSLLHIDASGKLNLESAALACGHKLVEHGLENVLAVSRLHYHFPLSNEERIVAASSDSSKSKSPFVLSQQEKQPIIIKKPQQPTSTDIPYIFRFNDENGAVIPLEYLDAKSIEPTFGKTLAERVTEVLTNRPFLKDMFSTISQQGNINHLGFQLIFEDPILGGHDESKVLHEDNWDRYQEVAYRVFDGGKPTTVTSWRFANDPTDPVKARCYCQSRAYCQRTQNGHMRLSDGHNQYD